MIQTHKSFGLWRNCDISMIEDTSVQQSDFRRDRNQKGKHFTNVITETDPNQTVGRKMPTIKGSNFIQPKWTIIKI